MKGRSPDGEERVTWLRLPSWMIRVLYSLAAVRGWKRVENMHIQLKLEKVPNVDLTIFHHRHKTSPDPNMACFQPSPTRRNATISTYKSLSGFSLPQQWIIKYNLWEILHYYEMACEIALLAAGYDGMSGLCNGCCTPKREKKILHPLVFNILVSNLAIYFYKKTSLSSSSILNWLG
jgi:hypothetical protein